MATYTIYLSRKDTAELNGVAALDGRSPNAWIRDAALDALRAWRRPPPTGRGHTTGIPQPVDSRKERP